MLKIEEKKLDDVLVLRFYGRINTESVPQVKEKVRNVVETDTAKMVFNFAGVDFIDSSGLGCLVTCLRMAVKKNGDIKISSLREHIRSIIDVTRLDRLFEIYDNDAIAVQQF